MKSRVKMELAIFILLSVMFVQYALAVPTAPSSIVNISTEAPGLTPGAEINTTGGTITVMNLNATTQTPRWKAYVGNISGNIALADSTGQAIFDWDLVSVTGELYATRQSQIVDWSNIACASPLNITTDELQLNHTTTNEDSINNTFNETNHTGFYAGVTQIVENTCPSVRLYVNGAKQDADFEEVVLNDGEFNIYTSILENSTIGFDGTEYDFQVIVPENGLQSTQTPESYYFYVELM